MNFGIHFVPKNTAYIIERYGKYFKTLPASSLFLNPFLDKIAYVHKIRTELLLNIPSHPIRTKDNVIMFIKGWVNFEIVDPKLASYGVEGSPLYAVSQVAKTTIRSELREITLKDIWNTKISWELNNKIMESINVAGKSWGLECISCRVKEDVSITWKDSLPRLNNIEHSFISLPWRSWFLV
ncbi:uncharacterized protein C16G5.07c [Medicago truncatula]|nr:uncharacterized protein C16G5.07c-like [Medicago truncatula]